MATRTHHRTKADWAAAQARDRRDQAAALPVLPASDWRGIQQRTRTHAHLHAEASRFERMAASFRARGL